MPITAIQCNSMTMQFNATQCKLMQFDIVICNSCILLQFNAIQSKSSRFHPIQCNYMPFNAIQYNFMRFNENFMHSIAIQCNSM